MEGFALVAQGAVPLLRGTVAQVEFVPVSRDQLIAKKHLLIEPSSPQAAGDQFR